MAKKDEVSTAKDARVFGGGNCGATERILLLLSAEKGFQLILLQIRVSFS